MTFGGFGSFTYPLMTLAVRANALLAIPGSLHVCSYAHFVVFVPRRPMTAHVFSSSCWICCAGPSAGSRLRPAAAAILLHLESLLEGECAVAASAQTRWGLPARV
jgi:hypothetical protein